MSDTDDKIPPEDDGKLAAGEYVLGVLDARARSEIAQRIEKEPDLAREVAFWEEKLGGIADNVKPVVPPAQTWSHIEAAIGAAAAAVAAGPAPERAGLWRSLAFWRTFAIGSAAVAAACIAALAYLGTHPPREPGPYLATLGQPGGQPSFVAAVGRGGAMVIVPASLLTRDQKSMELWLIPAGDKPHSLGLIAPTQAVRITVPAELVPRVNAEAALAVSLEEPGGSKTGQPSSDIIATGKLTAL
jgi:anti-sigma-K factor RskA